MQLPARPRRALLAAAMTLVVAADVAAVAVTAAAGNPAPRTRPVALAPAAAPAAAATPAAPRPVVVRHAWVVPAVANVWESPRKVRPIDRLTMGTHPRMREWAHAMTLAQRLDLSGRLMTQALRGDRVAVVMSRAGWSLVRLESQTGGAFRHGIIGWIPSAQLRNRLVHPTPGTAPATVRRTAATAVSAASRYLGVHYLWAGMSRYGIDCSGLTYVAFRAAGVTLARDAADQALTGTPVSRAHLRRGDLVFFGRGARTNIHHVGIYLGNGLVLHAPHTGSSVRVTPLSAWSDYWGARRVLH